MAGGANSDAEFGSFSAAENGVRAVSILAPEKSATDFLTEFRVGIRLCRGWSRGRERGARRAR